MDVQHQHPPSSLSEERPAAGNDGAVEAAAGTSKTGGDAPTVKDTDATTPAETNESSESVISTSDASAATITANSEPSNGSSEVESKAKSEDQVDKVTAAGSDDVLMREMEAIEGGVEKASETHTNSEAVLSEVDVAGTKELLEVLENDAIEKGSENNEAQSNVSAETSEAACVDSTTNTSLQRTYSDEAVPISPSEAKMSCSDSTDPSVNVADIASNAPTSDGVTDVAEEAMEVDDPPSENSAKEKSSKNKDETISSTSSDDARGAPVAAVEPQSIDPPSVEIPSKSQNDASSTDDKAKDEVVTSSKDHPVAATNEADSSDVTPKDLATTASEASVIADTDLDTTRPSETTASAYELDQTLEMGAEPSASRAENKLLTNMMNNGSSTPNSNPVSAAATPNVFNSTPILKQFEISSENVSKIDEHSTCDKTVSNVSSQDDIKSSSDALNTFSGTDSTETQSSDNLTHFANVIKKYNGLGSDSLLPNITTIVGPLLHIKSDSKTAHTANLVALSNGSAIDESTAHGLRGNDYEISVWYEDTEMQYLAVERLPNTKKSTTGLSTLDASSSSSSDKTSTTNGSVTSVGPFTLGPARDQTVSSNSSSTDSKFVMPTPPTHSPLIKQSVSGVVALCNFMIEHFGKIKQQLSAGPEDTPHTDSTPSTPVAGRSGKAGSIKKNLSKTAAASPTVVSTPKNRRGGKRSATSDTEDEPTQKKAKSLKKDPAETSMFISVLARWTDKKYYAGHVTDSKPGGKFVVLFEDGASKTLPGEFIVFGGGENSALPLLDQAVHVLVGGDTYEPGLVTEIDMTGATVIYTVMAESKTVSVSSSDIYLEEDQAKIIQSTAKRPADVDIKSPPDTPSKRSGRPTSKLGDSLASEAKRFAAAASEKKTPMATSPEPSTSGAAAGRAGRRNKRYS